MKPCEYVVDVGMKTMAHLIPGWSPAAVVGVVARELPLPSISLDDALVVATAHDAGEKRRAYGKAREIDSRSGIARRHRDDDVGRSGEPDSRSRGWDLSVEDDGAVRLNEFSKLATLLEHGQFCLNPLDIHAPPSTTRLVTR